MARPARQGARAVTQSGFYVLCSHLRILRVLSAGTYLHETVSVLVGSTLQRGSLRRLGTNACTLVRRLGARTRPRRELSRGAPTRATRRAAAGSTPTQGQHGRLPRPQRCPRQGTGARHPSVSVAIAHLSFSAPRPSRPPPAATASSLGTASHDQRQAVGLAAG